MNHKLTKFSLLVFLFFLNLLPSMWIQNEIQQQMMIYIPHLEYEYDVYQSHEAVRLAVMSERDHQQIECLARNVWYEARGESIRGQRAVAHVTMNRVQDPRYPNSVCAVVRQYSTVNGRKICQFSWQCDSNRRMVRNSSDEWKRIWEISVQVYHGNDRDLTHGATHFHANHVNPAWANRLSNTVSIGQHAFYKYP